MPDNRLARTRAAYESTDPMNRLARIYLKHASGLIRDGRGAEAVSAIDEAVRILGPQPIVLNPALNIEFKWEGLAKF